MKQKASFKNMPKRQAKKFARLKWSSMRQRAKKGFTPNARSR